MALQNLSYVLAERPIDGIIPGKTLRQKISPLPSPNNLKEGEILVETLYLGLEPAMRGWLDDTRSYVPPVQIGETMRAGSVVRVLASKSKQAVKGDIVFAWSGWTQYAIVPEGNFEPASFFPNLHHPQAILSSLGITSLTAWVGMTKFADPQPGELVVVSGAAGATGSIAGQIAKIKGATVVGVCGSEEKCRWLEKELGFDVALNYKAPGFEKKFAEATKAYIDVYYDNVGGRILELALDRAKEHARFVECGIISQYNTSSPQGPRNFTRVITMRIKLQGFIISDHVQDFPKARAELSQWLADGKLKKSETLVKGGLESAEQTLLDLYNGINTGKLIVEVKGADESPTKL